MQHELMYPYIVIQKEYNWFNREFGGSYCFFFSKEHFGLMVLIFVIFFLSRNNLVKCHKCDIENTC
jgi:hypothetical protein